MLGSIVLTGDCRELLKTLPNRSVHCIVTSPPYFGLRNYNVADQMGLEPTLAAYIDGMVAVFRECRRVLRDDGTFWLVIGDSYAGAGKTGGATEKQSTNVGSFVGGKVMVPQGLKAKDLMMVPARLAIALQADGWWIRSDIIWAKPNPMPESVLDRPTSAHEHIFLLTKSARYFYDAAAVRTSLLPSSLDRLNQDVNAQDGLNRANGGAKTNGAMKAVARIDKQRGHGRRHDGFNDRWNEMPKSEQMAGGANLRNVWTIATQGFPGSHFADVSHGDCPPLHQGGLPRGRDRARSVSWIGDDADGCGTIGSRRNRHRT